MNKATLAQRLFAIADWWERVEESKKIRRAVLLFICFAAGFFSKAIIDILGR